MGSGSSQWSRVGGRDNFYMLYRKPKVNVFLVLEGTEKTDKITKMSEEPPNGKILYFCD